MYNIISLSLDNNNRIKEKTNLNVVQNTSNNQLTFDYVNEYANITVSFTQPNGWRSPEYYAQLKYDSALDRKYGEFNIPEAITTFVIANQTSATLKATINTYGYNNSGSIIKASTMIIDINTTYASNEPAYSMLTLEEANQMRQAINDISAKFDEFTVGDITVSGATNDGVGNNIYEYYISKEQSKTDDESTLASAKEYTDELEARLDDEFATDKELTDGLGTKVSTDFLFNSETGKVNTDLLPEHLDDVLEFNSYESFPETGSTGILYIATDTNITWRWTGERYIKSGTVNELVIGTVEGTAYDGGKGTALEARVAVNEEDITNIKTTIEDNDKAVYEKIDEVDAKLVAVDEDLQSQITSNDDELKIINETFAELRDYGLETEDGMLIGADVLMDKDGVGRTYEDLIDYVQSGYDDTELQERMDKVEVMASGEFVKVNSLDEVTTINPKSIYLVPKADGGFDEYIFIDGTPELIGNTDIDLSYIEEQLATLSEVDKALVATDEALAAMDEALAARIKKLEDTPGTDVEEVQGLIDNSIKDLATESYVDGKVSELVDSSPEALNTLKELADALGGDANFSTTVTELIGTKLSSEDAASTYATKEDLETTEGKITALESDIKVTIDDIESRFVGSIQDGKAYKVNDVVIYNGDAYKCTVAHTYTLTSGFISDNFEILNASYITKAVADYIETSSDILETLDKLSAALNDDENFATNVLALIDTKLSKEDAETFYATKTSLAALEETLTDKLDNLPTGTDEDKVNELIDDKVKNAAYINEENTFTEEQRFEAGIKVIAETGLCFEADGTDKCTTIVGYDDGNNGIKSEVNMSGDFNFNTNGFNVLINDLEIGRGEDGEDGTDAYELAVAQGYVGSEIEWIASLKGDKGDTGEQGIQGLQGINGSQGIQGPEGPQGPKGDTGDNGEDGTALKVTFTVNDYNELLGFTGFGYYNQIALCTTEAKYYTYSMNVSTYSYEWTYLPNVGTGTQGIQGEQGIQGPQGEQGEQGVQGEQGIQGVQGVAGVDGERGASAYEIAVSNGWQTTEELWLSSLEGAKGSQGIQGIQGQQGIQGVVGPEGPSGVVTGMATEYEMLYSGSIGSLVVDAYKTVTISGVNLYEYTDFRCGGSTWGQGKVIVTGENTVQVYNNTTWVSSLSGIYARKMNGQITEATGLVGPQGIQGIQGEQGVQGPQGPAGNDGADGFVNETMYWDLISKIQTLENKIAELENKE